MFSNLLIWFMMFFILKCHVVSSEDMTFDDFVDICRKEPVTTEEDLMKAFRKIDINGDGYISLDELFKILTTVSCLLNNYFITYKKNHNSCCSCYSNSFDTRRFSISEPKGSNYHCQETCYMFLVD